MPFALIPFLLLAIPILEIAVFILVGNAIGSLVRDGVVRRKNKTLLVHDYVKLRMLAEM